MPSNGFQSSFVPYLRCRDGGRDPKQRTQDTKAEMALSGDLIQTPHLTGKEKA